MNWADADAPHAARSPGRHNRRSRRSEGRRRYPATYFSKIATRRTAPTPRSASSSASEFSTRPQGTTTVVTDSSDDTAAPEPKSKVRRTTIHRPPVVGPDPARAPTETSSKYWGVTWQQSSKLWQAQYTDADNTTQYLGVFRTQEAAALKVNAAIETLPAHIQRRRRKNEVDAATGKLVPLKKSVAPGHGPRCHRYRQKPKQHALRAPAARAARSPSTSSSRTTTTRRPDAAKTTATSSRIAPPHSASAGRERPAHVEVRGALDPHDGPRLRDGHEAVEGRIRARPRPPSRSSIFGRVEARAPRMIRAERVQEPRVRQGRVDGHPPDTIGSLAAALMAISEPYE